MRILGIDPGSVSGAYALLAGSTLIVDDLPVVDRNVDAGEFARVVSALKVDVCILERVSAFPGQGISSAFNFGRGYGTVIGVVGALNIPLELVTPAVWKKKFNLGRDKEKSRELARRLFPSTEGMTRVKDAGRCEAALMAVWLKETKYARTSA